MIAKLSYQSLFFLRDVCTDLHLQLAAVNVAVSHYTPCSNENSISEALFSLKQKVLFPLHARLKPQHADGLRVQSGSLTVRRHRRYRLNLHSSYKNSKLCLLLMVQSWVCNIQS